MGHELSFLSILPFAGLLFCIAVLPLAAPRFWERDSNRAVVAAAFSAPVIAYLLIGFGPRGAHELLEKGKEYFSFITLLGALYVITGGIHVGGSLSGTPLLNTAILAIGAVLASVIGTTGASILLVRPLLKANAPRVKKVHIVIFFIFIVSNCGGLLTALGDPPLFLGYLKGVPFTWTFRLWKEWLLVNGVLLIVFNVWDQWIFDKEEKERPGSQLEEVQRHEPLRIDGLSNAGFLAAIVAILFASGKGLGHAGQPWPFGVPEGLMGAAVLGSWLSTTPGVRAANAFTFGPILEVAILFAGIFVTMAPTLLLLNAHATSLGLSRPWHFFWATGLLSSILDNAPTYLTFGAVASGLANVPVEGRFLGVLANSAAHAPLLIAISCGSVFMGANSYVGNGPNFMVKAIAEESGVRMPSFFGYMAYSVGILIPLFVVVTLTRFL